MTEKSYFWDYGAGGDAVYAPYDAAEFNLFHHLPAAVGETTAAYIVPDYLNSLWVRSAGEGTHAVVVNTGAACFYNYLYINDASVTLPITRAASGTARLDIIVLRYDFTDAVPTIRAAVIEGGAATYPTVPAVTQVPGTWEVLLATVYIDGDATYILDEYVRDERKFLYTDHVRQKYGVPDNLLRNSEWFSVYASAGAAAPSAWGEYGSTFLADGSTAITLGSGRGNLAIDAAGGVGGACQWIRGGKSRVYTARGSIENVVDGYSVGIRGFRENGEESSVAKAMTFMGCPAVSTCTTDWEYQFTIEFPEDDIQDILFYFESIDDAAGTSTADMGQVQLVAGYFPANYHKSHEAIMHSYEIDDAAWNGDAKSTGTTTINFNADFKGFLISSQVPFYTKFVIMTIRARDSGSAAGAPYVRVLGYAAPYNTVYGTVRLEGVFNDSWREIQAVIPANQIYWKTGVAGGQLRIEVSATGVGTTDVYAEVIGIII